MDNKVNPADVPKKNWPQGKRYLLWDLGHLALTNTHPSR